MRPVRLTRAPKYGNQKTRSGFDSKREERRYGELLLEEKAGLITKLRRQVEFPLVVNRVLIARYVADFVYERDGREVVEDAKGVRTRDFVMKKKLMRAIYEIDVVEV
ncbi:MAG TPA: DUF1064 domain-containing protein [Thermoanaerobaculia bacterium]|nr:DUF1064 domain-containing protein [Thermoanaerobaculia bacterium]